MSAYSIRYVERAARRRAFTGGFITYIVSNRHVVINVIDLVALRPCPQLWTRPEEENAGPTW
ncbi:hypothetical protein GCM10010236_11280 [Streptomyces eurythermus]|nr:hypothetical protein GCM10010236_11280 [Streptomyces eurythermus]